MFDFFQWACKLFNGHSTLFLPVLLVIFCHSLWVYIEVERISQIKEGKRKVGYGENYRRQMATIDNKVLGIFSIQN